ncbi:MAG: glycerol-3-phosphate acyltransferase [Acidimicrobiia bacterium]|nr:glycerol-3-phosphate acyltransferase [Acidimicrobiia bacterium]MDH3426736.1 glycerol-3-phosphate acyltransferase [Acidimicrobiia bacterium]MDH5615728.1 glycerol-3-phosphate acyltransferase [Acidimicrobiia bacterium]
MALEAGLLIVGAYVVGSIPTGYLAARLLKDMDLRRYGSGTPTGSMVYEHVARWAVIPVGLIDIGKVALPTWLALQLELGVGGATAAGLTAVVGHNWPLFLGFTGGRGVSGFLGVLAVIFPLGTAWLLGFLLVGWRLGDSTVWTLAALATLPVFSWQVDGPAIMPVTAGAMVLLTLAKRVEANRRPLPSAGPNRRRVVLRRLLFDRDVSSHHDWIRRTPDKP